MIKLQNGASHFNYFGTDIRHDKNNEVKFGKFRPSAEQSIVYLEATYFE